MTGQSRDSEQPTPRISAGQTLIFLGDHTSPDDPGYVGIMREVLARFRPELKLNLISAGSRGQTASGLRSPALMQLITSSKPDWLVVGIGLVDAMLEPVARTLLDDYRKHLPERVQDDADDVFGPEFQVQVSPAEKQGNGRATDLQLEHLAPFSEDYRAALQELRAAGVRCAVLTTTTVGDDLKNPLNDILRLYNRAIRDAAAEAGALLIDVERAFRDLFDRASNYKQMVALTGTTGGLNAQGQTLLARTALSGFGLLPSPGFRPLR